MTSQIPPVPYAFGPFRVARVLGVGGFGRAVGAQDLSSQRLLCLKVFRKDRLKNRRTEESLLNELEVYKRIASSKWCPAKTFLMELEMSFQTDDSVCFAMDLMAHDLNHYMIHRPAYCDEHACRWSAQLALGINALHEMGIIHRDLKAENILIDVRENVRIADFGLSHMDEKPLDLWRKCSSDVVGTAHCMAPEILRNKKERRSMRYGLHVDWWAFGCIVYELVSWKHKALFDSECDIVDYVAWRSCSNLTYRSFPAFKDLDDPTVTDLIAGLLEPFPLLRYAFAEVEKHKYFLNDRGTSEFSGACSRALRRQEQLHILPDLQVGQNETAEILCPLPSWRSPRVSGVDWVKPKPRVVFFS
ncbi:kinase-like domain-containing protein [Suillus clintonianus]|uniref:kinase-like domain-containing protein n=1 Tax=Suillus clintonianus TaxID=1904413 RepID=UPI001B86470C|nr:kinase-like domain-containing protein [Suillus clintonianus]KAG2124653.1 kinase-like domain-containing protein [Suillus clintonianus]